MRRRKGAAVRGELGLPASLAARSGAWLTAHMRSLIFSFGHVARAPVNSALTALMIGISLALPAGLYVILDNVVDLSRGWDSPSRISLYLRTEVAPARAQALRQELAARDDVQSVELIDREAALAEYRELSGFGEALETLEENPLPSVLLVTPLAALTDIDAVRALRDRLARLPEVELAQIDLEWLERLHAITAVFQRGVAVLAGILAIAVLAVIGNTIRLAIANRREEIETSMLFGATAAFIRRPFLYNGWLLGSLGGAIAWALVSGGLLLLREPLAALARLYHSDFTIAGMNLPGGLALIVLGGGLGLGGSWFAVGRRLAQLQRHLRA